MQPDKLFEHAKTRFDHETQKRILKETYQSRMIFEHAGGLWRAGPELQVLLSTCPESTAVILDLYENPIQIDVDELLTKSQQRWQEQMNQWLCAFEEMSRQR